MIYLDNHFTEVTGTAVALAVYLVIRILIRKYVSKRALLQSFNDLRSLQIRRIMSRVSTLLFLLVVAVIWNLTLQGISVYMASIVTVVGVGLFANWSMVSNVTASIILYFYFPFKLGSKVEIMDGDKSVTGVVVDISLFSIKLKADNGVEVYYPNNLAIQRSIKHLGE